MPEVFQPYQTNSDPELLVLCNELNIAEDLAESFSLFNIHRYAIKPISAEHIPSEAVVLVIFQEEESDHLEAVILALEQTGSAALLVGISESYITLGPIYIGGYGPNPVRALRNLRESLVREKWIPAEGTWIDDLRALEIYQQWRVMLHNNLGTELQNLLGINPHPHFSYFHVFRVMAKGREYPVELERVIFDEQAVPKGDSDHLMARLKVESMIALSTDIQTQGKHAL